MANYHILKIDSLLESLTLCNSEDGFRFQLDFTEDIIAEPGDVVLGYLTAPIDEIRYIFEVISSDDEAIVLKKKYEVSEGVTIDLSTIPELQPVAYTKEYMTITAGTYGRIKSKLLGLAFGLASVKKKTSTSPTAQTIYYGCPGTGKSYEVKKIAEGEDGEKIIWYEQATQTDKSCKKFEGIPTDEQKKSLTNNIFRTTFHPDYDYATFVGCYKPGMDEGKQLEYKFVPQVFTNAYVCALRHPDDPVFLIIEEINRGNCAQIFGDLFQLLDRTDGVSDYEIKPDAELAKYLKAEGVPSEGLRLPANLHIYATMNTSDQSLFPMDSAFKRRWAMEYKPIEYDNAKASRFEIQIGTDKYPWLKFLRMVNDMIINATDSEDKQMGEFFIKDSVSEKEFINKVMFYIWNDVCKDLYNPRRVSAPFFMRITDKLDTEKNDYFTFAELFSERNKDSRLLKGFIKYLETKYKENHPEAAE